MDTMMMVMIIVVVNITVVDGDDDTDDDDQIVDNIFTQVARWLWFLQMFYRIKL